MRTTHKTREIIGFRLEALDQVVGKDEAAALLRWFRVRDFLLAGHGDKAAMQLPVRREVGGKLVSKLRFLVVDAKRLSAAMRPTEE